MAAGEIMRGEADSEIIMMILMRKGARDCFARLRLGPGDEKEMEFQVTLDVWCPRRARMSLY
eukprot:2578441-Rhodomonas_salina.1